MKHKAADVVIDMAKAFLWGLAAGIAVGGVSFFLGLLFSGSQVKGWDVCKSALSVFTAILLLVVAGMLMMKGKKPERFIQKDSWQQHFRVLGYKAVIGIAAVPTVLLLSLADLLYKTASM